MEQTDIELVQTAVCSLSLFSEQRVLKTSEYLGGGGQCQMCLNTASNFRRTMQFTSRGSKMTGLVSTQIIQWISFLIVCSVTKISRTLGGLPGIEERAQANSSCLCCILSWRKNFLGPQPFPCVSKRLKCNPRAILLFGTEPPGYQQPNLASCNCCPEWIQLVSPSSCPDVSIQQLSSLLLVQSWLLCFLCCPPFP